MRVLQFSTFVDELICWIAGCYNCSGFICNSTFCHYFNNFLVKWHLLPYKLRRVIASKRNAVTLFNWTHKSILSFNYPRVKYRAEHDCTFEKVENETATRITK